MKKILILKTENSNGLGSEQMGIRLMVTYEIFRCLPLQQVYRHKKYIPAQFLGPPWSACDYLV